MSDDLYVNADAVAACAELAARIGASGFEVGHLLDDVPMAEAGWYAHAEFDGERVMVGDRRSADDAARALVQRLLAGATCRCQRPVSLSPLRRGCRWKQVDGRWWAGCDIPPIRARDFSKIWLTLAGHRRVAKHRK